MKNRFVMNHKFVVLDPAFSEKSDEIFFGFEEYLRGFCRCWQLMLLTQMSEDSSQKSLLVPSLEYHTRVMKDKPDSCVIHLASAVVMTLDKERSPVLDSDEQVMLMIRSAFHSFMIEIPYHLKHTHIKSVS